MAYLRSVVITFIWLHSIPVLAWNQLPLPTESPHILLPGQVQFDFGLQYLSNKNFPFSPFSRHYSRDVLSLPSLGIHIGLGKHTELHITYDVLFVEEEEYQIREVWESGDIAFFTKVEILEERQIRPGIGIKIGVKLPNARDQYRVGTDETDLAFSALCEKTFSALTMTTNLGLLILGNPYDNAEQDDLLSYGMAWTIPWRESITSTAEIAGQAFGITHNEQASALLHLQFHDGDLTWKISGRVGLLENSEDWGITGGVSMTRYILTRWTSGK